jgi:hypothetical protein
MARIRTIKPEFWTDEKIVECSTTARLLFIGLWNFCDDQGIHQYSPKQIKMEVFPGDNCTPQDIEKHLSELISNGLIKTYHIESKKYLIINGWHHQRIDKPSNKHPIPITFDDHSKNTPRAIVDGPPADSKGRERKGRERKGRESIAKKNKTPLSNDFDISNEVKEWAKKKGHSRLQEHLEAFKAKCKANGYQYIDWDSAFMEAIRADWAKLRQTGGNGNGTDKRGHSQGGSGIQKEYTGEHAEISDQQRAANVKRLKELTGTIATSPMPGKV